MRGLTWTEDPGWIQGLGGRFQETRLKGWKEAGARRVGPGLGGGGTRCPGRRHSTRAADTLGHATKPTNECLSSTSCVRRATSKAQTQGSRYLSASQLGATSCPLSGHTGRFLLPPLVLPSAPPSRPGSSRLVLLMPVELPAADSLATSGLCSDVPSSRDCPCLPR